MDMIYRAYSENDLTEELKHKIGMFYLDYAYGSYICMPPYLVAYTIDGAIYKIELKLDYWKRQLRFVNNGPGYVNRLYDLEKKGWKKYYSFKLETFYLVAPEYIKKADYIVGEKDPSYAHNDLQALFTSEKNCIFYSWQKALVPSKSIESPPFVLRNGSIRYWIGNEPKSKNIRLSLEAVVEMAEQDDINCFYYSLSREKSELPQMLSEKRRENLDLVQIIDTPDLDVEDVIETLTKQLDIDDRRIFCVIDELPLLSTREMGKTRIEDNSVVLRKLDEFTIKNRVGFLCNLFVSKYARCRSAALDELREYAPIELFDDQCSFIEYGLMSRFSTN